MRVLFIDIDTLRPDHMGCYGYHRNTTPNMDRICEEGVRFDRYYTSDAPCLPSRAALISGMFGFKSGAVGHGGTAADRRINGSERRFRNPLDQGNFHNIFRKAGMHTASISTFPERHSMWWFNAGLNETYNVGGGGMESGEEILSVALDWLQRKGSEEDWYLHVHLWDPHTPYRAPESFGEPFADSPIQSWYTEEILEKHKKHTGPHSIMETGMYDDDLDAYPRQPGKCEDMATLKKFIDGYDTGIAYADYLFGELVVQLKSLGIYEDTAIILTSDHGENMGELGIYAEHGTADHGTCHIPMILKWPGAAASKVDMDYHYNFDLLPTLCDLLKVEKSPWWDGISFAEILRDRDASETSRDHLILSQNAHVCQRSARFDDWLYIRTIHDGYHLFDREMLFHLKSDPYEQENISSLHPEVCEKGARLILNWQEDMMLSDPLASDPMWTVMREGGPEHTRTDLKLYIERLRATGRETGAKMLEEKYL